MLFIGPRNMMASYILYVIILHITAPNQPYPHKTKTQMKHTYIWYVVKMLRFIKDTIVVIFGFGLYGLIAVGNINVTSRSIYTFIFVSTLVVALYVILCWTLNILKTRYPHEYGSLNTHTSIKRIGIALLAIACITGVSFLLTLMSLTK